MAVHPLAGKPAPKEILTDIPRLLADYARVVPDAEDPAQRVSFGTSGHRGSSTSGSFNEAHILAISQAIVEHRAAAGIRGPLFMGMDTHALSAPALATALTVFAAHGVDVMIQAGGGFTPTPVISHAILGHNKNPQNARADGVVVTPSHNPPQDGGFKYNPPEGGPADTATTKAIEDRANELLRAKLAGVRRLTMDFLPDVDVPWRPMWRTWAMLSTCRPSPRRASPLGPTRCAARAWVFWSPSQSVGASNSPWSTRLWTRPSPS